jgi:exodeoxyribonuclease VII small subunit
MAKKTFEQSIEQLEKIVQEMEDGDMPLEKAMKKFEEGIKLSNDCMDQLDETEKKITMLIKENERSRPLEEPFSPDLEDTE